MKTIVQITLAFALLFACAQQTTAQQLKGMSLDEIQKQFSSCSHNSAGATIKITSVHADVSSVCCKTIYFDCIL